MALGPDGTVCTDELVAAMRARLDRLDPPAGANVDETEVQENFRALGAGLHAVLTGPDRAEVRSAAVQDPAFWTWVSALTASVSALAAWQSGVRAAFTAWVPVDAPGQALRTAVLGLSGAPAVPPAPTSLTGVVR